MSMGLEAKWEAKIKKKLVGRRIVSVHYMNDEEAEICGFYKKPLVIQLDDGSLIYPMSDDEGNDGGAMGTEWKDLPTIPVIHT